MWACVELCKVLGMDDLVIRGEQPVSAKKPKDNIMGRNLEQAKN